MVFIDGSFFRMCMHVVNSCLVLFYLNISSLEFRGLELLYVGFQELLTAKKEN